MCGVFGYVTNRHTTLSEDRQKLRWRILSALLYANAERGTDSAGLALLINGHGCKIIKKAVDPYVFAALPEVRALAKLNAFCTIGHTRLATHGTIKDRNAHPFQVNHIVGTHNGIIYNFRDLQPNALVDSEAAFGILARKGVRGLKKLRGSAALVWIDLKRHTLNLYKHDNPLHMIYVPSIDTLFWSSEYAPLCAAVVGSGLTNWHERTLESDGVYTHEEYDPSKPVIPFEIKMQSWGYWQAVGGSGNTHCYGEKNGHKLWHTFDDDKPEDEDELGGVEVNGVCDWCQTNGSLRWFEEYGGWLCALCVNELEEAEMFEKSGGIETENNGENEYERGYDPTQGRVVVRKKDVDDRPDDD